MASSYVEVRESENGTEGGLLQFEINPCESNGMEVPSHIEGEPPKDHTYTKDPEVVEEENPESVLEETAQLGEEKESDVEPVKKSSRIAKNSKQKTLKSRTGEKSTRSTQKKDTLKKVGSKKKLAEKEEEKNQEVADTEETGDESPAKEENPENAAEEPIVGKRKSRKRKADEAPIAEVNAKQSKLTTETEKVEPNAEKAEPVEFAAEEAQHQQEDEEGEVAEDEEKEQESEEQEQENEIKESKPQKKSKQPRQKSSRSSKEAKTKNVKKLKEPVKNTKPKVVPEKKNKTTGEPHSSLPPGWTRKLVERKSGKTAGLVDIYIYSPDGIKFRSRPDIAAYLSRVKSNLKVEDFNFTKRGLSGSTAKPLADKKKVPIRGTEKIANKQKKKTSNTGSNNVGKRGQKLLVKLSVNTPKKRVLLDSANQKGAKKSKTETNKSSAQKGTGGNRRKK